MGFRDGRKANSVNFPLVGLYIEYNFATKELNKKKTPFNYIQRSGFNEEIVEVFNDFEVNSSDISIETYANIAFKPQDEFIDAFGNEYTITIVTREADTNVYRRNKKNKNAHRFQKKIIFAE